MVGVRLGAVLVTGIILATIFWHVDNSRHPRATGILCLRHVDDILHLRRGDASVPA
uniref:Uncharacterized protein n=1 Tax=Nelumbo nucifera TaxID=4432 RepID=A0A822XU70_NELNU|nr:TPA_asm: hypothetical protein HUJ06_025005 [Nelumbo nucifera]